MTLEEISNKYILVNSDSERDGLLAHFDSLGLKWANGQNPNEFIPNTRYPYSLQISYGDIVYNMGEIYDIKYEDLNIGKLQIYKTRQGGRIDVTILTHGKMGILLDSHGLRRHEYGIIENDIWEVWDKSAFKLSTEDVKIESKEIKLYTDGKSILYVNSENRTLITNHNIENYIGNIDASWKPLSEVIFRNNK